MYSSISILVFVGFYLWYATSKKMKIQALFGMESWSQEHVVPSKVLGAIFLVAAAALSSYFFGLAAGLFVFFVVLMTLASLMILILPLGLVNKLNLGIAVFVLLLLELLC